MDFVSISSRARVPPFVATNDMQSVCPSVPSARSVAAAASTNRSASPSRGADYPTRPSRSVRAGRPWSRGCSGSDQSIVRPAAPFVRSYLPAQMFPTLTYLSERAYRRRAARHARLHLLSYRALRVVFHFHLDRRRRRRCRRTAPRSALTGRRINRASSIVHSAEAGPAAAAARRR